MIGGETGIRTLGGVAPTTVFETAPFDHSGTSPRGSGGGRLMGFGGGIKGGFGENAKNPTPAPVAMRGYEYLGKMKGRRAAVLGARGRGEMVLDFGVAMGEKRASGQG